MVRKTIPWFPIGLYLFLFPPVAFASPDSINQTGLFELSAGTVGIRDSYQVSAFNFQYIFERRFQVSCAPYRDCRNQSDSTLWVCRIELEWFINSRWMIIPSLSAGLYYPVCGQGLGNTLEFFSRLEIAYQFKNLSRLGLVLGHMSNARVGCENPGTEFLFLSYTIPVDHIFGSGKQKMNHSWPG